MTVALWAISQRVGRLEIGTISAADVPSIPAEHLTLEIVGDALPASAMLDGVEVRLILDRDSRRGLYMLNAIRSVGFHRLVVGAQEFVFCTDDVKLKLNGILALLKYLEDAGLSWGQQLFFADGTAIRSPRIDYAWLAQNGPKIVDVAESITKQPMRQLRRRIERSPPTGSRILPRQTVSLIHRNPASLLEPHPDGIIALAGKRYFPREVVSAKPERSFETIGNRRATRLLRLTWELTQGVLAERPPANQRDAMTVLSARVATLLQEFPFAQLLAVDESVHDLPPDPIREEVSDDRYRASFDLHEELSQRLGWEPGIQHADRFAFVKYSDEIYQAFVVGALARAFDAAAVFPVLAPNRSRPSFRSDRYDIFYDTVPPRHRFENWRDKSSRPSDMSPDICIIDRVHQRGVLGDAKYRVDDRGRATSDAIAECQVYMQSFNQPAIAVFYPANQTRVETIGNGANAILEVGVGPYANLEEYMRRDVRPRLEQLMVALPGP